MLSISDFIIAVVSAFVISWITTPFLKKIAEKFEILDKPNESHKSQVKAIPYLGGVALVFSVVCVTFFGTALRFNGESTFVSLAVFILLPALLLSVVGLVDDIKKLSPTSRFVVQTIAGVFTAIALVSTKTAGSPIGLFWFDFLISILWIVGIANSINFLDNHDGGAAGIVATSSFFLFVLAQMSSQSLIAALSIAMCGACLGFLVWNKHPASIYMGDAGALFLGTLLAGILVRFNPDTGNRFASFLMPVLLVAIPILDTSVAVFSRIVRGKSPFNGGRDHLSHRLLRIGYSSANAPRILWLYSSIFGSTTVVIALSNELLQTYLSFLAIGFWVLLFAKFWRIPHE